ncbi:hypothetical protein SD10_02075 [Spirosoma radiotolerans]|uniref:Uncharacterized protein n=1 Tax=Spirosoma radiotolerans TaxID=1379870 RepID=A0A0E3V5R0_9BACT|nr:hypothetical protein SD10_02075 [Spirosoma radiotolerans]
MSYDIVTNGQKRSLTVESQEEADTAFVIQLPALNSASVLSQKTPGLWSNRYFTFCDAVKLPNTDWITFSQNSW